MGAIGEIPEVPSENPIGDGIHIQSFRVGFSLAKVAKYLKGSSADDQDGANSKPVDFKLCGFFQHVSRSNRRSLIASTFGISTIMTRSGTLRCFFQFEDVGGHAETNLCQEGSKRLKGK